jgi:hypothetical protein
LIGQPQPHDYPAQAPVRPAATARPDGKAQ